VCELNFSIEDPVEGPILFYYQLDNYYQNHRLYVKSVEPKQLEGEALNYDQLSNCFPLQGPPGFEGPQRPVYYPCGLIANSLFNGNAALAIIDKFIYHSRYLQPYYPCRR
jgi:LEM3 (ligand-effect modulator 3) family / CDC50 family